MDPISTAIFQTLNFQVGISCDCPGAITHLEATWKKAYLETRHCKITSAMKIEQHDSATSGYFQALDNGTEAGRMVYHWGSGGRLVIDHTEVNPSFQGQSIGKQLVMASVDHARAKGVKILPLCSFAKSVFDKTEAIRDVLA